jgi:hypothetical protein
MVSVATKHAKPDFFDLGGDNSRHLFGHPMSHLSENISEIGAGASSLNAGFRLLLRFRFRHPIVFKMKAGSRNGTQDISYLSSVGDIRSVGT